MIDAHDRAAHADSEEGSLGADDVGDDDVVAALGSVSFGWLVIDILVLLECGGGRADLGVSRGRATGFGGARSRGT